MRVTHKKKSRQNRNITPSFFHERQTNALVCCFVFSTLDVEEVQLPLVCAHVCYSFERLCTCVFPQFTMSLFVFFREQVVFIFTTISSLLSCIFFVTAQHDIIYGAKDRQTRILALLWCLYFALGCLAMCHTKRERQKNKPPSDKNTPPQHPSGEKRHRKKKGPIQ